MACNVCDINGIMYMLGSQAMSPDHGTADPLTVQSAPSGFHVCSAGWFDKGRVGYPIVKAGTNCGFGRVGIIDYGYRLNKSERWDVYCYNPNGE